MGRAQGSELEQATLHLPELVFGIWLSVDVTQELQPVSSPAVLSLLVMTSCQTHPVSSQAFIIYDMELQ